MKFSSKKSTKLNAFTEDSIQNVLDKSWTLFLDRDGVINIEKQADYINSWEEFNFYPTATQAIANLTKIFGKIIIVTNQKGIGKGVTQLDAVHQIHAKMITAIEAAGGKIAAIYYCPDIDNSSPCRKPNIGMAMQAQKQFPDIDYSKSIIVGNNPSDLEFGRNAGMQTILVTTTREISSVESHLVDANFESLLAFSNYLSDSIKK